MFNSLSNYEISLRGGYTILHSYQQSESSSCSITLLTLSLVWVWFGGVMAGGRVGCFLVFVCLLGIWLCIYLFTIYISSLVKCSLKNLLLIF